MKIEITIIGGTSSTDKSLKEIVGTALINGGFQGYTEFGKLVAQITKQSDHCEVAAVSRIMTGISRRIEPSRAGAYAEILGVDKQVLLSFGQAGKHHRPKPISIDDSVDISVLVKNLAKIKDPSVKDLVKEILYLSHS